MRLTRLETFANEFVCFVKATAEDGAVGWGQTSTYNADITATVFHRQIAPWALGQPCGDIAALVERIERAEHKYPGSYRNRALAGLDTALWDMAGRRAGLPVAALGLSLAARDRLGASGAEDAGPAEAVPTEAALAAIDDAALLILPWNALEAGSELPELAEAIAASRAHKLLLPTPASGVDWVGVDRWETPELIEQTVAAVRQIAAGVPVEPERPLGVGTLILLAIGGLVTLLIVGVPLASLVARLF